VINNYIMGRHRLYSDRKPSSLFKMLQAIAQTIIIDFTLLSMGMLFLKPLYASRGFFILFLAYCFIFLACERMLLQLYYDRPWAKRKNLRKILIVGDLDRGRVVTELMHRQLSWGHEIVGHFTISKQSENRKSMGTADELYRLLHTETIDEVIFTLDADPSIDLEAYLKKCRIIGVTARVVPALWSPDDMNMRTDNLQGVPFLTFEADSFNATGLLYKRVLDIIGGILGTLIFLMIYPFVALAIKVDSPGPILFKQTRAGQHGRKFMVYKFRSMYIDAEARKKDYMGDNEMNGAIFKMKDDPRITKVGRWLRKTSIDEIPQFLNVLRGEMSLVGTRPPTIDEVEQYQDWHYKRISAKPGITGLWQISGRNEITDFDKIVELDTIYLENWRFLDDIKILLKTIWVVLKGRGAQ
jgi:exopolysaccharide biosynthesis polyprenyl glycosylphosphotransferase